MIEFKTFEVKGTLNVEGEITGYGAIFDNVDRGGDVIKKGAFAKTISENGGSVIMVANHDQNKPIGRVTEMKEDATGLLFKGYLSKTDRAQEYKQLMKDGVVDSFSIGYAVVKGDRNDHGGRDLAELKLFEISPVAIPMNPEAKLLEVKNISKEDNREDTLERFEMLAKNIGKKSMKLQNEAELLKLAELYKSVTQPLQVDTEPIVDPEVQANLDFLNALNDALTNN
jgi:HK97 family phage prohead protease